MTGLAATDGEATATAGDDAGVIVAVELADAGAAAEADFTGGGSSLSICAIVAAADGAGCWLRRTATMLSRRTRPSAPPFTPSLNCPPAVAVRSVASISA